MIAGILRNPFESFRGALLIYIYRGISAAKARSRDRFSIEKLKTFERWRAEQS